MQSRKVTLFDGKPTVLQSQEDVNELKLENLGGRIYYGVLNRKDFSSKSGDGTRDFLYKLHEFHYFEHPLASFGNRGLELVFYQWIAMWNTGVYHGQYSTIEEAILDALKLGWKVAQIGNSANEMIIQSVKYAREGK